MGWVTQGFKLPNPLCVVAKPKDLWSTVRARPAAQEQLDSCSIRGTQPPAAAIPLDAPVCAPSTVAVVLTDEGKLSPSPSATESHCEQEIAAPSEPPWPQHKK